MSINYDPGTDVCYRTLDFLGFPGYRVGDDGSVWTQRKPGGHGVYDTWRTLRPESGHKGHLRVLLMPGRVRFLIHHLVLFAFVGPCPSGMECRHFPDPDPSNNRLGNIQWGTRSQNQRDRDFHGTRLQLGSLNPIAKLDESTVLNLRADHESGNYLQYELANKYHVSTALVSLIINRKIWTHI